MKPDFTYLPEERRQDGGMTYTVQVVGCSHPGCTEALDFKRAGGKNKPPNQIAKMAQNKGWVVDLKHGKHLCPKHAAPEKREEPMSKTASMIPPKSEPQIEPKMRRMIFREIDDSYDEKGQCYVSGITDHTIAAKLNTTWGWVARVREENFGPAGPDPRIAKMEEQLAALETKATAAEVAALEAAELADTLVKKVAAMRIELDKLK